MSTCTITGRCVDANGSAALYTGQTVTLKPLGAPYEQQQGDAVWAEVGPGYLSAVIDSGGNWSINAPRPGIQSPIVAWQLTTPLNTITGFIPDVAAATEQQLLAGAYGTAWTVLSTEQSTGTPGSQFAPVGPATGTTYGTVEMANMLLDGAYAGGSETCITTFGPGTITDVWTTLGLTKITTFVPGGITETVRVTATNTVVRVKNTFFNPGGISVEFS